MSLHSDPEFSNAVPAGWVTLEEFNRRCTRRGVLPPQRTVLHLGERLAAALTYVDSPPSSDRPPSPVPWDASSCHVLLGPGGRIGMSVDSTPSAHAAQPDEHQHKLAKLGSLLYETLTGAKPLPPQPGGVVSIIEPSCHRPDVGAALDDALMGCIHPQEYEPIHSAEALGKLLAQLLKQSGNPADSKNMPSEAGTCSVTARFVLDLFPSLSTHSTLSVTPAGETPPWLPLAHLIPLPQVGPNIPATPILISEDVPMGNEWDLSEHSELGLENEGSSMLNRPGHSSATKKVGQQTLDPFIERRGEEQDLFVRSSDTPHRLLWAVLAVLGPLAILAIGQALKH